MGIKLRNIVARDLDEVFAYSSIVQIKLKSKTLSFITMAGQLLVILIFIYQNLIAKKNFYEYQVTHGFASVQAVGAGMNPKGATFASGLIYDQFDNCIINGNEIFVGFRRIDWGNQVKKVCPNMHRKCSYSSECTEVGGESCQKGYCVGPNWCPEDMKSVKTTDFDYTKLHFWIRSKVTFDALMQGGTNTFEYQNDFNAFVPLEHLLDQIPNIKPKLIEKGGIISVTAIYSCITPISCKPQFVTQYIEFPFEGKYAVNYGRQVFNGNSISKLSSSYEGIRVIFNVEGVGKQISMIKILFLLTQLLAVTMLPKFIADIVFVNFLPESELYRNYKYQVISSKVISEVKLKTKMKSQANKKRKEKEDKEKKLREEAKEGQDGSSDDSDLLSDSDDESVE